MRRTHRPVMGTDAPPARRTLAGTLLLAGVVTLGVAALSAPALAAGLFVTAAVVTAVVRSVREGSFRTDRQRRTVCLPGTGICVEA